MMGAAKPLQGVSPQVYTDLGGLQNLKAQAGDDKAAQIAAVAEQFEALMMQMMLKSMRDANAVFGEGNPLSSSETEFYQEMFDHQLSVSLSQSGGGLGLAKALERQLGAAAGLAAPSTSAAVDDSLTRRRDLRYHAGRSALDVLQQATAVQLPSVPPAAAPRGVDFDGSAAAFVATVAPLAERAAAELGVDSRVLVSQAALETGWGSKLLRRADGTPSFNFFNIKAGSGWQGDVVQVPTVEYRDGVAVREAAAFRAYDSPAAGFADYVRLIQKNPRYREALELADDPRQYMQALASAGYATDPQYAEKVLAVLATEHVDGARDRQ